MQSFVTLVLALWLLATSGLVEARSAGSPGGHSTGSGKSSGSSKSQSSPSIQGPRTYVKGHYRKDGTYVQGYYRRAPGTASGPSAARFASSPSSYVPTGYVGARDDHGRIVRSEAAKHEFWRESDYPHGRPGYVVDHIVPLKRGGCDCPSNMQWQTVAEAKAKDKWE
jgi:hypothetical protein